MRLWQYWLHYLASGLHNSVTKQRVLAFPLDQSDSVKVIERTSVLQNLRAAAPGRVHLCSVFNCRVIFCPCQHSARSNHPPPPAHPSPDASAQLALFVYAVNNFETLRTFLPSLRFRRSSFQISAHEKWIIVPPLESRHVRVIVTQLAFFNFFFFESCVPFGAEIVALEDFHFTSFHLSNMFSVLFLPLH